MTENYVISKNDDLETRFKFVKDMIGIYCVEELTPTYKGISPYLAKLLGWNQIDDALNQSAYNIPCQAAEAAPLYHKYLNITIQLQKKVTAIQIVNCKFGLSILIAQRVPIIDNNNKIRGAFSSGIDLTNIFQTKYKWIDESDNRFNCKTIPKQYILTPEASPLPLTHRQQECLSLLIRGKTYKEIAYMLNVSDRTIEDHIHAIKYKLGCYNKSQLIEKAIDSGFLFHVPETLFGLLK